MSTKKKSFGGLAILTAFAASLCCITPVLAFVAGIGGMASSFSWMEPFRPYLIGMTLAVLAFAWYQKLKPKKAIDCACDNDQKVPFIQTKTFLGIITLFAGIMLSFPSYVHVFYPETATNNTSIEANQIETLTFKVSGMTCAGCEEHITHAVNELKGIQSVNADYDKEQTTVQFDKTQSTKTEIEAAINSTGYKVID